MLPEKEFLHVVANAPLVSIDLVIRNSRGELLMGKRTNEPGLGTWFVPGGRVYKGEALEAAFARITTAELGREIGLSQAKLCGAFTHIYDNNFANEPGISTHYVVLAYLLEMDLTTRHLPKGQHNAYRWIPASDPDPQVHPNARAYFDALTKPTQGLA